MAASFVASVGDGDRLLERSAHREPVAHAQLVRRGEHALVDVADEQDVGRAAARGERPQELDAVGVGQMQLHHHQRRLERLEQLHETRARGGARNRIADALRDLADEVDDSIVLFDDQ